MAGADVGSSREVQRRRRWVKLAVLVWTIVSLLWLRAVTYDGSGFVPIPQIDPFLLVIIIFFGLLIGLMFGQQLMTARSPHVMYRPEQITTTMDDVVGIDQVKDDVVRSLNLFLAHKTFRDEMGGSARSHSTETTARTSTASLTHRRRRWTSREEPTSAPAMSSTPTPAAPISWSSLVAGLAAAGVRSLTEVLLGAERTERALRPMSSPILPSPYQVGTTQSHCHPFGPFSPPRPVTKTPPQASSPANRSSSQPCGPAAGPRAPRASV